MPIALIILNIAIENNDICEPKVHIMPRLLQVVLVNHSVCILQYFEL